MRRPILAALLLPLLLIPACRLADDDDESATQPAVTQPEPAPEPPRQVSVPSVGFQRFDPAVLERYRLDPAWRTAAESDRLGRLQSGAAPQSGAPLPPATTEPPPPSPTTTAPPEDEDRILAAQVLLDRARFSPGVIDGRWGQNTEKALYWLQFARGLQPTGVLDDATLAELERSAAGEPVVEVEVTAADLEGPFTEVPEDPYEQAELECLCYASPAEAIAERYHTTPEHLAKLNPEADLDALTAGTRLSVPNVEPLDPANRQRAAGGDQVAQLLVSKRGFYTQALDAQGRRPLPLPLDRRLAVRPLAGRRVQGHRRRLQARPSTTSRPSSTRCRTTSPRRTSPPAPTRPSASPGSTSPSPTTASTAPPSPRPSATPAPTAASA